jgi:hypothetical protein
MEKEASTTHAVVAANMAEEASTTDAAVAANMAEEASMTHAAAVASMEKEASTTHAVVAANMAEEASTTDATVAANMAEEASMAHAAARMVSRWARLAEGVSTTPVAALPITAQRSVTRESPAMSKPGGAANRVKNEDNCPQLLLPPAPQSPA